MFAAILYSETTDLKTESGTKEVGWEGVDKAKLDIFNTSRWAEGHVNQPLNRMKLTSDSFPAAPFDIPCWNRPYHIPCLSKGDDHLLTHIPHLCRRSGIPGIR